MRGIVQEAEENTAEENSSKLYYKVVAENSCLYEKRFDLIYEI